MLEKEDAADGDERDSERRPGGIRDADGNGTQTEAQQIERSHIADEREDRRDNLRKLFRHFEERRAGRFHDNCEKKE